MKITGTCHCGAVTIEAPTKPRTLTDCNCSLCRRYGVLWAYYRADTVQVTSTLPQAFESYSWGGKTIGFHRCRGCGCVTHYTRVGSPRPRPHMAINARLLDLAILEETPLRKLDGARKWRTVRAEPQYKVLAPARPSTRTASTRAASPREASTREASTREASTRKASPRTASPREASTREASTRMASTREASNAAADHARPQPSHGGRVIAKTTRVRRARPKARTRSRG